MPNKENQLDNLFDAMGAQLIAERKEQILNAFEDISLELAKLRQLDLHDVHPAVVYKPQGIVIGEKDDL
jgi:hypothetical protein